MPVKAQKGDIVRYFDCAQWDAMPSGNNGWTLLFRDCEGEQPNSRRPFAEVTINPPFGIGGGAGMEVIGDEPIIVSFNQGAFTVSVQQSDILAGSNKVSVAGGSNKVLGTTDATLDVVEANMSLQNIGGLLNLSQIAQGGAQTGQGVFWNGSSWVAQAPPGGGGGTVTSVGMTLPASLFSVAGSPVTTSGTLAGSLINQTANLIFAGPGSGSPAVPTFRALVALDIPNLDASKITTGVFPIVRGGTGLSTLGSALQVLRVNAGGTALEYVTPASGTVTSVGLALPSIFSISGSPVTSSGTLTGTLATQNANIVFAGPSSGGAAAPTFRALVATDIPNLDASKITTGTFAVARGGTGLSTIGSGLQVLRVNAGGTALEYATPASGTVTSVALSMPAIFSVSGSPVTSSGTLTATLATQTANRVFAGPASGAAAAPTFRAMVALDIPNLDAAKITTGIFPIARGGTGLATLGTALQFLRVNAGGTALEYATISIPSGTVTSVGLAMPSIFSVTGSPITGAGTLNATLNTQTAFTFFAGPSSGGAAAPAFRLIVANDLPVLSGLNGSLNLSQLAQGGATSGQVLTWSGSAWAPATPSSGLNGAENGLSVVANKVRLGGSLLEDTTIDQLAYKLRIHSNYTVFNRFAASNPTPYAVLTVDGTAASPVSIATPSEDAVLNLRGYQAANVDASLAFGIFTVAADGAWIQSRATTAYNTPRPIKIQPRKGKVTFGSTSNFDSVYTMVGNDLGASGLSSVILHIAAAIETKVKMTLGLNTAIRAGFTADGTGNISRIFHNDGGSGAQIRFSIGGEEVDKVIITQPGNVGINFNSTTGLHSRLTVKGSIAGQGADSTGAYSMDIASFVAVYTGTSDVTWTLDDPTTCAGRMHIICNHSQAGVMTLSRNVRPAFNQQFNTLSPGEMAIIFAAGPIWRGKKLT